MSSIRRIIVAASVETCISWTLTRRGSITLIFNMSLTFPFNTSTPAYLPPFLWDLRTSSIISIGSSPAFSARVFGMISIAFAYASIAICSRPPTVVAYSRNAIEIHVAAAPPPAVILPSSKATFTTNKASCIPRSSSSTTCSVLPRIRIETAFGFLQSVTNVILSSPIFCSSTLPANPRSFCESSSRFATTIAPVAFASLSMSLFFARLTA